jgi:signal transduction histidine kinase
MFIAELQRANEELKRLSKLKDDFLGIASHDLRTPFNAILGFSEILLESGLSEENKEIVQLMYQSAETQLQYVDELLSIVAFEAGKLKLKLINTNIQDIINECISYHKIIAKNKNIKLTTDVKCSRKINLDKTKILQVLNNLVSNAIKFTPKGGEITLKCIVDEKNIEVHVIDTGLGMDEKQQEKVFSRYEKVHLQGTEGEQGTGLGLVICKNFVELHGGQIRVNSGKDKGSDFYFTLPVEQS